MQPIDHEALGRVFRRREALVALGGLAGVAFWRGAHSAIAADPEADAAAVCFLQPEVTEGPFWITNKLTRTEFQLLELLMLNPRRVLPHDLIYDRVWGYNFGPASNAMRVYVGYLRRKLEEAGARPLIHTVRGVGYVLREP